MTSTDPTNEILSHLQSRGLNPTTTWLATFLSAQRPSVPLAALKQTAQVRLTHTDITTTLQKPSDSTRTYPPDIHDASLRERRIQGPIVVQVLDIEDIGRSKWSQVGDLEAEERGETTKGREIIRVVPGEPGENDDQAIAHSNGPHKLTLQDAQGKSAYGFELSSVEGVDMSMNIGSKIVLRDVTVARGVLLLEPRSVVVLGGRIDELHKKWREKRKETLKAAASTNGT